MGRWVWASFGVVWIVACGQGEEHGSRGGNTSGSSGVGGESGGSFSGRSGSSTAASGGSGGNGSGMSAGGSGAGRGAAGAGPRGGSAGAVSPYGTPELMPDIDTTPVASCAGQEDMTLCEVTTIPDRAYDICVGGQCVSPGCGDPSCNSPTPHFRIPPNSTHTYLTTIPGPEPIVVDLVTGLGWQGCVAGRSGAMCETGTPQRMNWDDALAYCDSLSWGDKDDWYLPDSYEVLSILDFAAAGTGPGYALSSTFFPHAESQLWTSHYSIDFKVFLVQFYGPSIWAASTIYGESRTSDYPVRCARRGFSRNGGYTTTRFVTSTPASAQEPVIDDAATGLEWQGCILGHSGGNCSGGSTEELRPAAWVAACDELTWAGHADWRLPTFKELHSIALYPKRVGDDPAIDETIFDPHHDFSSYLGARSGDGADAVNMLFQVDGADKVGPADSEDAVYPALCVRWRTTSGS